MTAGRPTLVCWIRPNSRPSLATGVSRPTEAAHRGHGATTIRDQGSGMNHHNSRFGQALLYAETAHTGQLRKGTSVPYVAHLLGVAALALEHGADEDEAIAAL